MTAMPRKKGGEVTPRRLSDLEPHRRRPVVIRAVLSIALTWVASLTVYYLAPIGRAGRVREACGLLSDSSWSVSWCSGGHARSSPRTSQDCEPWKGSR